MPPQLGGLDYVESFFNRVLETCQVLICSLLMNDLSHLEGAVLCLAWRPPILSGSATPCQRACYYMQPLGNWRFYRNREDSCSSGL